MVTGTLCLVQSLGENECSPLSEDALLCAFCSEKWGARRSPHQTVHHHIPTEVDFCSRNNIRQVFGNGIRGTYMLKITAIHFRDLADSPHFPLVPHPAPSDYSVFIILRLIVFVGVGLAARARICEPRIHSFQWLNGVRFRTKHGGHGHRGCHVRLLRVGGKKHVVNWRV